MTSKKRPNNIQSIREMEELAAHLDKRGAARLEEIIGQIHRIWEDEAGGKYTARLRSHVQHLHEAGQHLLQAQELLSGSHDETAGENP